MCKRGGNERGVRSGEEHHGEELHTASPQPLGNKSNFPIAWGSLRGDGHVQSIEGWITDPLCYGDAVHKAGPRKTSGNSPKQPCQFRLWP